MRERHLSLSLSYSCHPFTIPPAPKGLRSAAILPQVCVCLCVCVCAYVCNLCVYPHASVLCGTNRGLPWSAFGASSPIGVKEVRLVRSTSADLISWGTSFTGTSGLECLTTKSIGLAPIPVVLTPRPPRGSSSAIVMDFHHTLRALTPTLSDSALVLSGNSLCLGLKTFLSMYFRLGSPRTSFRTWFPSGVHQTPSDIFRISLPGLAFRISFPSVRKEFNTLVSDFVIITSVLDLAPVLLSFGSRTQNLYRTSDSLPWLIKPWKGNLTHHVSNLVPEDHHTSFGVSHRILFPGVSAPFRTL